MRADSWQIEADLVPGDLEEAVELRRAIITAGYSPAIASGIVGWLLEKAHEDVDRTGLDTRTRYRKVLVDVFGDGRGPAGRVRRRDTIPGLREAA